MKNAATVGGGSLWRWGTRVWARWGVGRTALHALLLLALLALGGRGLAQQSFLRFEQVDDACLEADALVQSTQRYLDGGAPVSGVQIVLSTAGGTASFAVTHRGEVVARRSFSVLPESCLARRKALGLAMALSLESVGLGRMVSPAAPDAAEAHADPRSSGVGTAPLAPNTDRSARAGSSPAPTSSRSRGRSLGRPRQKRAGRRGGVSQAATAGPASASLSSGPEAEDGAPPEVAQATPAAPQPPLAASPVGQEGLAAVLSTTATGGLLVGLRSHYGGALQLGLAVRLSSIEVEAAGLWAPAVGDDFDGSDGGRVVTTVYGGRLSGCLMHDFASLPLGVCLGAMGGRVLASGEGFEGSDRQAGRFWLSADLAGRAYVPLIGGLSLAMQVDMLLHVLRPVLVVEGDGGGQQDPGIAAILASLGLRWTFF